MYRSRKRCRSNEIRNPKSGRCVKKSGKIGKRILKSKSQSRKRRQVRTKSVIAASIDMNYYHFIKKIAIERGILLTRDRLKQGFFDCVIPEQIQSFNYNDYIDKIKSLEMDGMIELCEKMGYHGYTNYVHDPYELVTFIIENIFLN